ncbi:glycosyltransferase family 2 protein [bacterium]|nr:glycosyltransferase family 2 protein [bacterium]
MALDVSVVISTRNNLEGLKRVLTSLDEQTFLENRYEIFVADDSDNSETQDHVTSLSRPKVATYYYSSERQGYQAGRNKCIKQTESNIILFLNDSCVAPATLIEEHFKAHVAFPHAIVRGPLMPLRGLVMAELPPFTAPQLDFTIINSSIPRLGIAKIETFDEACQESFQDTEMYWRLRECGFKETFVSPCYCFQNYLCYQEHSLATIKSRAKYLADSAIEYYRSQPSSSRQEAIQLDFHLNVLQLLLANSAGHSIASSFLQGKLEGTGWLQSSLMDSEFYYYYYRFLKEQLRSI